MDNDNSEKVETSDTIADNLEDPNEENRDETTRDEANNKSNIPHPIANDRIDYPSKDGTYLSQLYNQPLVTTLSSFSHVANIVRNPYEFINNVDEFVKQARNNRSKPNNSPQSRISGNIAHILNTNNQSPVPNSPVQREMDTFINYNDDQQMSSCQSTSRHNNISHGDTFPIPALPPIECSKKRGRVKPLTIEEYMDSYFERATDLELLERIFYGGMSCKTLKANLWPYLFGLVKHRGRFEKIIGSQNESAYIFVDHEANSETWCRLETLYGKYVRQWKAILPDQETRFSAFRERKSLIERDVIRCDRLHQFYADQPQHLSRLTDMLMTYMMYDFDIGYVQGMSDLAGPILYMYDGNPLKAFWVFVEVMKLFRRNFELTQKTIHFQLDCLSRLVECTDPIFAQYLEEHESSNCFFAFRAIVCQFKRELMKDDERDYDKVLYLWDTIWSVSKLDNLRKLEKSKDNPSESGLGQNQLTSRVQETHDNQSIATSSVASKLPINTDGDQYIQLCDPNQADSPRHTLTETETFVLALCLSMIRRERDLIMASQLDGTDIHLHFIDPKLSTDLDDFIEHTINIYSYLKNDFDINKLTGPKETPAATQDGPASPIESTEGYDLCSDFLIINGASGS